MQVHGFTILLAHVRVQVPVEPMYVIYWFLFVYHPYTSYIHPRNPRKSTRIAKYSMYAANTRITNTSIRNYNTYNCCGYISACNDLEFSVTYYTSKSDIIDIR